MKTVLDTIMQDKHKCDTNMLKTSAFNKVMATIGLRWYFKGQVPKDYLGYYASMVTQEVISPYQGKVDSCRNYFWNLARSYSEDLHERLGKHIKEILSSVLWYEARCDLGMCLLWSTVKLLKGNKDQNNGSHLCLYFLAQFAHYLTSNLNVVLHFQPVNLRMTDRSFSGGYQKYCYYPATTVHMGQSLNHQIWRLLKSMGLFLGVVTVLRRLFSMFLMLLWMKKWALPPGFRLQDRARLMLKSSWKN